MGTTVLVDSDGDVAEMVPWLTDAGIEGVLPPERQAGVDAAALRAAHPRWLMIGHYDKTVMARGETARPQRNLRRFILAGIRPSGDTIWAVIIPMDGQ